MSHLVKLVSFFMSLAYFESRYGSRAKDMWVKNPLACLLSLDSGQVIYKVSLWEGLFEFPNLMFLLQIAGDLAIRE